MRAIYLLAVLMITAMMLVSGCCVCCFPCGPCGTGDHGYRYYSESSDASADISNTSVRQSLDPGQFTQDQ